MMANKGRKTDCLASLEKLTEHAGEALAEHAATERDGNIMTITEISLLKGRFNRDCEPSKGMLGDQSEKEQERNIHWEGRQGRKGRRKEEQLALQPREW